MITKRFDTLHIMRANNGVIVNTGTDSFVFTDYRDFSGFLAEHIHEQVPTLDVNLDEEQSDGQ